MVAHYNANAMNHSAQLEGVVRAWPILQQTSSIYLYIISIYQILYDILLAPLDLPHPAKNFIVHVPQVCARSLAASGETGS